MTSKREIQSWARQETLGADCGDKRLNRRLGLLLNSLGQAPGASIPQACQGRHSEIAAAYRFFDHEAATPANILAPHAQATQARIAAHPTVLLVQDTTEMDMSQPQQRIHGAGPLDDSARQGALVHLMHAFTPEGTPLGSVWHQLIVRAERPANGKKKKSRSQRKSLPIEEKESHRWIQGLTAAQSLAQAQPQVRHICIADSEADIYEYLAHVPSTARTGQDSTGQDSAGQLQWIVRACQDRALQQQQKQQPAAADSPTGSSVWEACRAAPVLWRRGLHVRGRKSKIACDKRARRQPREDRQVMVEARAVEQLRLRPPQRTGHRLEVVTLNAVLVSEVDPPEGEVAVEWLLLTSLSVSSAAQVQEVVEAYSQRFMIEVFFRVLKSGCRIEEKRFESAHRHLSHLALALIIAWRVLWLSQMGQHEAQRDGGEVFRPEEWQSAWAVIKRGEPMPERAPSVGEVIKLVGKLGGWIERRGKSASPPGVQTLWQGLQRLHDLSTIWLMCRSATCV
jgi:hypothetical protein